MPTINEKLLCKLKKAGIDLPESPTFEVLWSLLPRSIEKSFTCYWLKLDKDSDGVTLYSRIAYEGLRERTLMAYDTTEQSLEDAAGNLLLHLVERKLMKMDSGVGKPKTQQ